VLLWFIQIPGGGLPILVLVEQTLGGYPKLGSVISADIWKIGQAKPGDRFFFKGVSLKDAVLALRS
jgi:allophanate hydrolase subunit 2